MRPENMRTKLHPWFLLRRISVTVCLSALLFAPHSRAQDVQEKIEVDNVSRNFVVHLPRGYEAKQHYPVVILLPGQNQEPDDMQRLTHFDQLISDTNGVITAYPHATRGRWNSGAHQERPAMAPRRGYGRHGGMGGGGCTGGG